jgi:hypothetical protein
MHPQYLGSKQRKHHSAQKGTHQRITTSTVVESFPCLIAGMVLIVDVNVIHAVQVIEFLRWCQNNGRNRHSGKNQNGTFGLNRCDSSHGTNELWTDSLRTVKDGWFESKHGGWSCSCKAMV